MESVAFDLCHVDFKRGCASPSPAPVLTAAKEDSGIVSLGGLQEAGQCHAAREAQVRAEAAGKGDCVRMRAGKGEPAPKREARKQDGSGSCFT